ncbi:efflux RND transporter permease subunit [Microbacterium abyssi]|uniref:efflux RND transporter permease subunit n=1 Tax=Microbacterium abyssi TaxID=2782166 RepID=UPI0018871748|nr:efflux RND transporter permease subunit [Microbacterium sp. A18JL241]
MPAWLEELLHITVGRVSRHDDLPDLRHLPTRPVALHRTHYLVNDRERHSRKPRTYVLRTERRTRRGHASVVVSSNGRGVGYLPDDVARVMKPLLDQLGGAAVVNGSGARQGSIRLWVDLPAVAQFREFVAQGSR